MSFVGCLVWFPVRCFGVCVFCVSGVQGIHRVSLLCSFSSTSLPQVPLVAQFCFISPTGGSAMAPLLYVRPAFSGGDLDYVDLSDIFVDAVTYVYGSHYVTWPIR